MLATYPYSSLASGSAGTQMPAGTITGGFVPHWKGGGQLPWPQQSGGSNPLGGYISPTVNHAPLPGQQTPGKAGSMASPVAGVSMPAGTITGGFVPPWLLQQLGLGKQQNQQAPMSDFLASLGLGDFYRPHGMGDAQNAPVANSTVGGGIAAPPPPMRTVPVHTRTRG